MLAALVPSWMIDVRFKYTAKTLAIPDIHNRNTCFTIERARLEVTAHTVFLNTVSKIGFERTVQYKTHFAGPLIPQVVSVYVSAT